MRNLFSNSICNTNSESAWSYWTCSSYRVQGYSPTQTTLLCPSFVRLLYCCDRLESILRRCKRLGYCDADTQSVVEQFQLADETLFERVLNDDRHVLHLLLPSRTEYSYNLRRRRHDYELIAKTRTLNINNFIMRMLYKNFQIMRTCHLFY